MIHIQHADTNGEDEETDLSKTIVTATYHGKPAAALFASSQQAKAYKDICSLHLEDYLGEAISLNKRIDILMLGSTQLSCPGGVNGLRVLAVKVQHKPANAGPCKSCSSAETCASGFSLPYATIFTIFGYLCTLQTVEQLILVTPPGEEVCSAAKAENERKLKGRFQFFTILQRYGIDLLDRGDNYRYPHRHRPDCWRRDGWGHHGRFPDIVYRTEKVLKSQLRV